ncbi:toll-like receptor 2 [Centropristis striata]|uniref:toll-like receptor 2 n=1 Tax=Centropristis striata TaxID=184440 RepID=UPI0027DF34E5|nr:toll-like receptor 2 [Centropristis striata]
MRILAFLQFVLLLIDHTSSVSRPGCHCEQTSCYCSKLNLESVPAAPSQLITQLDLSFNRLKKITENDFVAFVSLRSLILNNNRIETIHDKAFVPLTNLEKLDLSLNRLDTLSAGWFENLFSLQSLNLLGNKYKSLGQGNLFQPLKSLKTLHFGGPHLQSVREADFSGLRGLEEVVFDGKNLRVYTEGSLRQIGPIKNATLGLNDTRFFLTHFGSIGWISRIDHLEAVVFKNVNVPQFYKFPALFFLQPLLSVVRKVSVLNCKLFLLPCQSSVDFAKLEFMDISDNLLTDLALSEMMCYGKGGLWSLQTFNVSRNQLHTINSQLFTKLDKLENIDMSGNVFHRMPETCFWPPSLRFLNLSATHLREVTTCLPMSLHILDLSDNDLTVFNIELPFLTELHISGNRIRSLPDGGLYPRLSYLFIQNNDLQWFSGNHLNMFNNLKSLEAGADTFHCSCDFIAFMRSGWKNHQVTFGDSKSYICDSPDALRGKSAADARLSVFECHTALAFSVLFLGILLVLALVAGLCHRFSVVWYVRMTWAWLRAKRKPKLKKGELQYDAFVSYSEMDSGWVEAHLIPELEQTEPRLRLCLHQRDFVPGAWILDNIMDAIEKSHRTLFVLSQHFVRSEWCKYELDYTHFRLFDQNDDSVVLILLEPIDKETIPKKFCKLRRVMNSRTYLEWPDEDHLVPRFWNSLKTAIKRPEADNGDILQFEEL